MPSLTLDWLQLAALIGSVQGVLLAVVLFGHRSNRTASRLLGVLMLTFTVFLASSAYYASGLFRRYPHFFGVSYLTPWLFGPLVYLYAVAASDRAWRFSRKDLLHFVPAALVLLVMGSFYMMS